VSVILARLNSILKFIDQSFNNCWVDKSPLGLVSNTFLPRDRSVHAAAKVGVELIKVIRILLLEGKLLPLLWLLRNKLPRFLSLEELLGSGRHLLASWGEASGHLALESHCVRVLGLIHLLHHHKLLVHELLLHLQIHLRHHWLLHRCKHHLLLNCGLCRKNLHVLRWHTDRVPHHGYEGWSRVEAVIIEDRGRGLRFQLGLCRFNGQQHGVLVC